MGFIFQSQRPKAWDSRSRACLKSPGLLWIFGTVPKIQSPNAMEFFISGSQKSGTVLDVGTVPKTQSPNTGFISQSQRPKACDSPKTLGLTVTEARESPDFKVFDTMLSAPLIVVIFFTYFIKKSFKAAILIL